MGIGGSVSVYSKMPKKPPSAPLPEPLARIVAAAREDCPEGHAEALEALLRLAATKVPARGIFAPRIRDEQELEKALDRVAGDHLRYREVRAAWGKALKALPVGFDQRDALETAALNLLDVREMTTFYAGLAFGLTWQR